MIEEIDNEAATEAVEKAETNGEEVVLAEAAEVVDIVDGEDSDLMSG
jgi:hypothetical protein